MRKNLVNYIGSDNAEIRGEYNKLRAQLGSILRELHALRDAGEEADVLSLDAIKLEMEENDIILNGDLDQLIREGRITAEMATSLMNDSGYSQHIARNLIDMGSSLFASHENNQVSQMIRAHFFCIGFDLCPDYISYLLFIPRGAGGFCKRLYKGFHKSSS